MEIRFLTHTLISFFLFTAGTRYLSALPYASTVSSPAPLTEPAKAIPYASPWEEPGDWLIKDSAGFRIYSCQRMLPAITEKVINNGVVMVWAKNLVDPALGLLEKPLCTPFYFFPDNGNSKYTEYWYTAAHVGGVALYFQANAGDAAIQNPNNKVRLRYIIIPKEVLQKNNQTTSTVYHLPYTQLTNMLGIEQ
jgi:hypothetical protein